MAETSATFKDLKIQDESYQQMSMKFTSLVPTKDEWVLEDDRR